VATTLEMNGHAVPITYQAATAGSTSRLRPRASALDDPRCGAEALVVLRFLIAPLSWRIRSNLAVSATAITAITPACTGSLTTRSRRRHAADHVQRDHAEAVLPTSSTASVISPPMIEPPGRAA